MEVIETVGAGVYSTGREIEVDFADGQIGIWTAGQSGTIIGYGQVTS